MNGLESPAWIRLHQLNRPGCLPTSAAAKLEFLAKLIEILSEDDEPDKAAEAKDDWGGAKQW